MDYLNAWVGVVGVFITLALAVLAMVSRNATRDVATSTLRATSSIDITADRS